MHKKEEIKKEVLEIGEYLGCNSGELWSEMSKLLDQAFEAGKGEKYNTHNILQEIMDDVSLLHQRKELDDNGFCTIRDLLHSKAITSY